MITTHVVGDVFVIVDPDGDLETVVAEQTTLDWMEIYTLLRGTFGDHYDFMSCYLDTGSGVVNLGSAAGSIYNDATGLGRWTFNFRPDWRTAKLQHYAHHSSFHLISQLHETGHRWLATVNYANSPGGPAQTLLHEDWIWSPGQKGGHWGRWLDNQNSCMDYDQAEWIDNGDGTFNRIDRNPNDPVHDEWFGYSPLDQYLMGLIPAAEVPDLKVVRNPSPTPTEGGPYGVTTGPYTPSPSALTVTISQVQNTRSDEPAPFSGPRNPAYLDTQRVFHEAVIVVTKNSSLASAFITETDTRRRSYTDKFRRVTSGRAMVDTSLLRANYADLYVKDNPSDTGGATSSAPFWESPDLWVRNSDDGETPGGDVHQAPVRGQTNWIYVRVRNKGAQPYQNVMVRVFLANFLDHFLPGTEFWYPVDWNPEGLLGTVTIPAVPAASAGSDGTAIAKFQWTAGEIPPAAGWHPCLLCEVVPIEIAPAGLHHVFQNRKLAQLNLTIVDPPKKPPPGGAGAYAFSLPFVVGHDLRRRRTGELRMQAEGRVDGIRLFLDPAEMVKEIADEAEVIRADLPFGRGRFLETAGVHAIEGKAREGVLGRPGGEAGRRPEYPPAGKFAKAYGARGLRPVVLNDLPLLEVTELEDARLSLPPREGGRTILRLIGVVPTGRGRKQSAVFRISEAVGDTVLGGITVRVNT